MFRRNLDRFIISLFFVSYVGLIAEFAFTEVSIDRAAIIGTIVTLQTLALLMIVAARIINQPEPKPRHRARKRRMQLPIL